MAILHKYAYVYLSDDGNNYAVVLNTQQATYGGFTPATGSEGWLPKRYKMRQAHFASATGRRHSFPCHSPGYSHFVDPSSGTLVYDGDEMTGTGATGERRTLTKAAP